MRVVVAAALVLLPLSGCTGPGAAGADAVDVVGPDAQATAGKAYATEVLDVAIAGTLDLRACVPAGVGACLLVDGGTRDGFQLVEPEREVVAYDLELRWEAASPLTDTLQFWVDRVEACGDGCWRFEGAQAEGPSPLHAMQEDAAVLGDGPLAIWVRQPNALVPPAYAFARTEQDFEVVGTVTVLAADDAAAPRGPA